MQCCSGCHSDCLRATLRSFAGVHSTTRSPHEFDHAASGHKTTLYTICSTQHADEGVHAPGHHSRSYHDCRSGRGQYVPGPARRHDDCGHLPGSRDWHGHSAPDERVDPGREHGPNHRLDRRVGCGRRSLYHSGFRAGRCLARVRRRAWILEVRRPHGGGRNFGHPVRDPAAPRHGGGPRTSLPGVGGRFRNP